MTWKKCSWLLAPAAMLLAQDVVWVAPGWRALTSIAKEIEPPNGGTQQTSATVFDIDGDKVNDFVITERTAAPSVIGYLRLKAGWKRFVIDPELVRIEAGAAFGDVDGDGDLDFTAGGEGRSNEVWWWENPGKGYDGTIAWKRRAIKSSGSNKHHDLLWIDVDHDGRRELVFWNQGGQRLMLATRPADVKASGEWPLTVIFEYSKDSEMLQRGTPPGFKGVNEHEGLWSADIDGDGTEDIVGGGYWFKRTAEGRFIPNTVDASYHFSRAAAGQFVEGGRPEVVLSVGDGLGPLLWYQWVKGTWRPHWLADLDNGHSMAVLDFNGDGKLDIFLAEMRLSSGNPGSKVSVFLGDGQGHFIQKTLATGFDNHESKVADLDGDGDLDVLMKPYNHATPALNVLLNEARK